MVVVMADTVASFFPFPRDPDAMRYMLTDELWAVLGPLVTRAKRHKGGQKPEVPDRVFFEVTPGDAVYNRLRRWVYSGSLKVLFELLTADPELGEVRRVLIDSTIVRAHQHAAGARRKKKRSGRPGRRENRVWAAAGAG